MCYAHLWYPNAALLNPLATAAFMNHVDHLGIYQLRKVGMIPECSTRDLLARAAVMCRADKRQTALMHSVALKR